jgi:hypothetical protein
VLLNQVALAPVVLAVVFAWNLSLTGEGQQIPGKIRRDLVPSMVNGGPIGAGLFDRGAVAGANGALLCGGFCATRPIPAPPPASPHPIHCRLEVLGARGQRQLLLCAP